METCFASPKSASRNSRWRLASRRFHYVGTDHRHRPGHDQQRGRHRSRRPAARLDEDGDPILPSFVGLSEDGKLLVGRAARNQWVLGPGAHDQVDQAQDGPGRARQARRAGVHAARNLRDDPAHVQGSCQPRTRRRGQKGRNHRAGVLQRQPAPGHPRGRGDRRAGGRAHPERADGRLAVLRSEPSRTASAVWSTTSAAAPSTCRSCSRRKAWSRYSPATATPQLGGDDFDERCSNTSPMNSRPNTASICAANVVSRARLLRAVEEAKRQLSAHPFVRIEEEFIAEKEGVPLHLNTEIEPRRTRGTDPTVDRPHDGLRAACPGRRQAHGPADRQGGAGRRQHAHAE